MQSALSRGGYSCYGASRLNWSRGIRKLTSPNGRDTVTPQHWRKSASLHDRLVILKDQTVGPSGRPDLDGKYHNSQASYLSRTNLPLVFVETFFDPQYTLNMDTPNRNQTLCEANPNRVRINLIVGPVSTQTLHLCQICNKRIAYQMLLVAR